MDAQLRKLADLEIDQSYHVLGYRPINTKFGDTYIITCRFYSYDIQPEFDMFATKLIASYISTYLPKEKFFFTVEGMQQRDIPTLRSMAINLLAHLFD
jgi:hypothetical protein